MAGKTRIILLWVVAGWWTFSATAGELGLNSAEQNYLHEHPVISMCVDPDWLPYEKLDAQNKHIGLVAEYMTLLQSRLGITIKAIKSQSWEETQRLYQNGLCDIVSALNKTPERSQYLAFTRPYITSPAVLILNEQNMLDNQLADLEGKTLAMVKDYVYESKLRQDHPGIKIMYVANMEVAFQKVSAGNVDATLGPLFLTFALMQELGLDNLKVVGNTAYQDELRIGIQKDNKVLAEVLNKAIANLTEDEHVAVRRAWAEKRNR